MGYKAGLTRTGSVLVAVLFAVSTAASASARAGSFPASTRTTLPNTLSGASFSSSFWSRSVASAPVAADSPAIVANIARQVADNYSGHVAFNDNTYDTTLYTVSAKQTRHNIGFTDCQHKGREPSSFTGPSGWFTRVPVPKGAIPAAGTDAEMTIWQPATDTLWEFWDVSHDAAGWHACYGGRMDKALHGQGVFANLGGATATGLPVAGGMVTLNDVRRGRIDHVMTLEVIEARKSPTRSWPAQRTDGQSTDPTTPMEGQRFRLDPSIDVASLGMTPLGVMIAKAAQKYGFVITDKSGSVAIQAESGLPLQKATGTNPWDTLLGVQTLHYALLDHFPWTSLQALPADFGK